jgi:hypothetical protein
MLTGFFMNFELLPDFDRLNLAQWFLRRRLKCEKLTTDDGRKKPDGKISHGLWPGELKRGQKGQTMI